jgi:hypothetical protein
MELAWPRLANEETATAIAVDKDTRTKVTTTSTVDREQIFRCMTRPQGMALLRGRGLVAAMCLGQVGNLLPHVVVPAIMAQHLYGG